MELTDVWAMAWPAILIAMLRIGDVSVNVLRTIFTVSGRRLAAALAHGVEAALWLSAAGIVFSDMTPARTAGFVIGVSSGTAIGMTIIQRLQLGMVTVRIYADVSERPNLGDLIAMTIREHGFGATTFDGHGYKGPVQMVLSTVRRRDADRVMNLARNVNGDVFATVDNTMHPGMTNARV